MKKRNLLCSAILSTTLSVMIGANALPCSVYAVETENSMDTVMTDGALIADEGASDAGMESESPVDTANIAETDSDTQDTVADADSEAGEADVKEAVAGEAAEEDVSEDEEEAAEEDVKEAAENVDGSTDSKDTTADQTTEQDAEQSHSGQSMGKSENTDGTGRNSSAKTSTSTSVQTVERFNYDITVIFTQMHNALTDISITTETSAKNINFVTKALTGITEKLKSNSELDAVSGATYSSNAIIAAINASNNYDSVSESLTSSVNGTTVSSSQEAQSGSDSQEKGQSDSEGSGKGQSGSEGSGKGQSGSEGSGKGQSGSDQESGKTVPANYITYTVADGTDGHKVVVFQLSPDAQKDNTYVNMALLVDDNGKHFMPVDAGSDETGNGNDYFAYQAENTSFSILNDSLTSIEVIFTSEEYGKVHFTVDLTAISGGNEEGSGAKEDDPKGNNDKDTEGTDSSETDNKKSEDTDQPVTEEKEEKEEKEETAATGNTDSDKDNKTPTGTVSNQTNSNGTTSNMSTSNSSTSTVKTGDSLSMILLPSLALISAMGMLVISLRKLKNAQ